MKRKEKIEQVYLGLFKYKWIQQGDVSYDYEGEIWIFQFVDKPIRTLSMNRRIARF